MFPWWLQPPSSPQSLSVIWFCFSFKCRLQKQTIQARLNWSAYNACFDYIVHIWTPHSGFVCVCVGVCAATAGSTILMSCQDGSGCVRGQDQQTRLIILPLHALMSYCTCGLSTAPAVTMTTQCRWHPPAPAMGHASILSTPTGTHQIMNEWLAVICICTDRCCKLLQIKRHIVYFACLTEYSKISPKHLHGVN